MACQLQQPFLRISQRFNVICMCFGFQFQETREPFEICEKPCLDLPNSHSKHERRWIRRFRARPILDQGRSALDAIEIRKDNDRRGLAEAAKRLKSLSEESVALPSQDVTHGNAALLGQASADVLSQLVFNCEKGVHGELSRRD